MYLAGKSEICRATGRLDTQTGVGAAFWRQNSFFSGRSADGMMPTHVILH